MASLRTRLARLHHPWIMPIVVDHEQQREHVALLAAHVVAGEGVGALTFRRMAAEAGTSTAIVSTYFEDKRDLLLSTFSSAARRTSVRFEAAQTTGGGLRECLEAWLPLDEDRLRDWRVIIAFWGVAVNDAELAAIQHGHMSRARKRIERLVMTHRGLTRSNAVVARTAEKVLALTTGIATQAAFEPASGHRIPQRELLASGLRELGAIS
ncbi:MAG: TetR family transcriptional regulator [Actinomycetales bacterium]|nr:TetR family transcriptional regulator [Actinomycetales bacterium]